ncbi:MAG: hypothetical protein EA421_00290 [Gemmatimonadales bacterium]|nr:MAG: hypothetical protein EA421_00290 [Gemmatimonadales bacterium]
MTHRLWLLEDETARRWVPFSETRPVGELLFGASRLRERIAGTLGMPVAGYLAPEALEGFAEEGTPPVVSLDQVDREGEARIVLSSRTVLEFPTHGEAHGPVAGVPSAREALEAGLAQAAREASRDAPVRIRVGGEGAGWILPPGIPLPPEGPDAGEWAQAVEPAGEVELPGHLLAAPWALVADNAGQLRRDLALIPPLAALEGTGTDTGRRTGSAGAGDSARDAVRTLLPAHPGVEFLGDHPITSGGPVEVDPQVILDAREGPIHLEAGVKIRAFTHLRGPAFIGAGTTLLGGLMESLSVGPGCKLRGEISESVILGWSNKAHDGYLGHALVGSWVNLGAGTTNSDLKNNYSPVRVPVGVEREVDTGLLKVGIFLGDHVKTGIGTLLSTGTQAGAGSNVFGGGGVPPRWIPPFSWGPTPPGSGPGPEGGFQRYDLPRFLETAARVMARRGQALSPGMTRVLTRAWERTHGPAGRLPGERDV